MFFSQRNPNVFGGEEMTGSFRIFTAAKKTHCKFLKCKKDIRFRIDFCGQKNGSLQGAMIFYTKSI
jgi:hypothetical protein